MSILKKIIAAGGDLYRVGGSVRDEIMGFTPHDYDFCVTGLSVEHFIELFPDAEIAGKDFPVFRIGGSEYALARTEKKKGRGYKGFEIYSSPEITIEEDLARRDLTINSIAINVATGDIVDPFGGVKDIKAGLVRATTPAFSEDPLRVYRTARFAAKFGFAVEPSTLKMMASLKAELNTLSVERVFVETRKALLAKKPSLFFRALKEADVLSVHFTEIASLVGVPQPKKYHPEGDAFEHTMSVLDKIRAMTEREEVVFAGLAHDLGKTLTDKSNWPHHYDHDKLGEKAISCLGARLKLPKAWITAGIEASKLHMKARLFDDMRTSKKVQFLEAVKKSVLGFDGLAAIVKADSGNDITKIKFIADEMFADVNGKTILFEKKGPEFAIALRQARVKWIKKHVLN